MNHQTIKSMLFLFMLLVPALSFAEGEALDPGNLDSEPPPPEQVFILSTEVLGPNKIRAKWHIVDGFYLYREKFHFKSNTPGIELNKGEYPKGHVKEDEFFGKVETYRGDIAIDIPIVRQQNVQNLQLTITSQGCADIGVCYPPLKQQVEMQLPPAAASPTSGTLTPGDKPALVETALTEVEPASKTSLAQNESSDALSAIKKLGASLLGDDENKFLPVDEAFEYSADIENGNALRAKWEIADGYYLYRDRISFSLQDANGIEIGQIKMPDGKEKVDESFGKMVVYFHKLNLLLPLNRTKTEPTNITLVAKYQGCAEAGLCYPPQTKAMPLSLPAAQAMATGQTTASSPTPGTGNDIPLSEQDQIAQTLAKGNAIVTIISFFGFGLLLAFTPCVFPMIPILSSIIVGQGDKITTRKAFVMSLVYVLAMAVAYTSAGIIAGIWGANLQAAFQNPWILGSFAAIFVALAFSMFGFYDIQMPNFIQSKLTEVSNRQQGGTLIGVAMMGLLSALIVGPCVAAPLAGALIYIGQTGDPYLGGTALFALSLGMGAPLVVIGTSAGKLLPRAGGWMDAVKAVFGVLMLAVAIWMLERIIPAEISMILWAMLLIVSAIYMGAIEPIPAGSNSWRKLWKGMGVGALIYGALLMIGVASGGKDALQPLGALFSASNSAGGAQQNELVFKQIKGIDGLEAELQNAKAQGKVAMLDFYADWCVSCKEMERYTFSNANVRKSLQDVVLLQADVTDNDALDKALLKKYGLVGPPSILFFDKHGNESRMFRLVGFLDADKFISHLNRVKQS